jgi:hypothetical protein
MHIRHWVGRVAVATALLWTILMGIGLFASVPTARANLPYPGTYEDRRTYYSDSSKTQIVGGWRYDCYGEITTWGTQTGYVSYQRIACN